MMIMMMMTTCNAKLELLPTNGSVTVIISLLKPFFNLNKLKFQKHVLIVSPTHYLCTYILDLVGKKTSLLPRLVLIWEPWVVGNCLQKVAVLLLVPLHLEFRDSDPSK